MADYEVEQEVTKTNEESLKDRSPLVSDSAPSAGPPSIILSNGPYATSQELIITPNQIQNAVQLNLNTLNLEIATGLRTPVTPSTPSTPGTAAVVDSKTGFKYNWDNSVNDPVIPVRCKNINGQLHKTKLGSGGRGKCILVDKRWLTPNEFEALSGRGSCKDWKRSIRYGGRTLHCLIDEGLLLPHAISCTCSACCDDSTVSGPIRLFIPYKKRRTKETDGRSVPDEPINTPEPLSDRLSPMLKDCVVMLTPMSTGISSAPSFTVSTPVVTSELVNAETTVASAPTLNMELLTPISQAPTPSSSSIDFAEQKQWWQLEEMVNTLINYGQQLKQLVEQAKQQSLMSREVALLQLRNQMEQEKREAVLLAGQKQGLQQTDHKEPKAKCANCNREALIECSFNCGKVNYCSNFCRQNDWKDHSKDCKKKA